MNIRLHEDDSPIGAQAAVPVGGLAEPELEKELRRVGFAGSRPRRRKRDTAWTPDRRLTLHQARATALALAPKDWGYPR